MTDTQFGAPAHVDFLPIARALPTLRSDLEQRSPTLLLCFLSDPMWFTDLFADHLNHSNLDVLCDHRQRTHLKPLLSTYKRLHVSSWSANRTMHDKRIIFPELGIIYLTTNNITQGSWSLSINSTARIQSAKLAHKLADDFQAMWLHAKPLLP